MTLEQKREASLAELLACMRQIISEDTHNLNNAKWLAATALATVATISKEGRIPTSEESIEWVKRRESGSSRCPVCSQPTPHSHSQEDLQEWVCSQAERVGLRIPKQWLSSKGDSNTSEKCATPSALTASEQRIKFETWWHRCHPWKLGADLKCTSKAGAYDDTNVNSAWLAWLAALEALAGGETDGQK